MHDDGFNRVIQSYPLLRISMQYCTPAMKERLIAMYGLLASVEVCLMRVSDPAISRAKLSWWQDELLHARAHPGNHPVTIHLQKSGALTCWSADLTKQLFTLAISRIDHPGIGDEASLKVLCEAIGKVHLELESKVFGEELPDCAMGSRAATIQGFTQILRESFLAKQASFYWIPLTCTARSGLARSQVSANRSGSANRQMMISIIELFMGWVENDPIRSRNSHQACAVLTPPPHWLIFAALQLRQLRRLQTALSEQRTKVDVADELLSVRISDGWAAWIKARQLCRALRERHD